MIKIITSILILVSISQSHSQELSKNELDSLYNLFTFVRGVNTSDKMQQMLDEKPGEKKCGLGLVTSIQQNLDEFSIEQQNILAELLERPQTQTSVVSSNGFFRIHYDSTGFNSLGYDLNLLLQAIDSVYSFEITYLGYPTPPSDGSAGGDDKYDIYVLNILDYGYTQPEDNVGTSSWNSYIVIDTDYGTGFYTHGIDAACVTVAHEFHHAIQMGNYAPINPNEPFRSSDIFFYELTSTSFEEFIFDSVNDYYAYTSSYFNHATLSMQNQNGYNLAIWNIYLQENFGFEILKNQWEQIPNKSALEAIALSILQLGSTLGIELNKFGIWTYFTNSRAIPGRYFKEAVNYPLMSPAATVSFTPPSGNYDMTIGPVANYFLKINLPSPDGVFYTIITNSDWQKTPSQTFPFSFSVFQDTLSGARVISENYSVSFSNDNQQYWDNAGILNNNVVYGDSTLTDVDDKKDLLPGRFILKQNYPNPFNPTTKIQFSISEPGNVNLTVFNLLGQKIKTLVNEYKASGEYTIIFNGSNLNSGVYFSKLAFNGLTQSRKMTFIK